MIVYYSVSESLFDFLLALTPEPCFFTYFIVALRDSPEAWLEHIIYSMRICFCGDCSHEIKRCLLLWRKVMTNLHSIFKSRDITLPTKVHLVKAMFFPVVMYGCESWNIRKLNAIELMLLNCGVGGRLLRVPWTARRSNQSILKEISPGCSLEGLMLKLKLQYFGHLMQRVAHWKRP